MSEHKNKLILAIAIAAIAVIIIGTVSYTFFPAQQKLGGNTNHATGPSDAAGPPGDTGVVITLPEISISSAGGGTSAYFRSEGTTYTQIRDVTGINVIVNESDAILDGSGFGFYNAELTLSGASNVTVENTQFTNGTQIDLEGVSHCTITKANMTNGQLDISNSNNNVISHSNLTAADIELSSSSDNLLMDNSLTNESAYGITLYWSTNNTISNNYFENNIDAIQDGYNSNVISNNTMVNCDGGALVGGNGNSIFDNKIALSNVGYQVQIGEGIVIGGSNNTVYQNSVSGYTTAGISIEAGSDTTLANGTLVSGVGTGNIVFKNIILDNNCGIEIGLKNYTPINNDPIYPVYNNTIYLNDFIDNNQSAMVYFPQTAALKDGIALFANYWDNGSVGNYWSDYTQRYPDAVEINNSGIMSTPYVIETANTDLFPLSQYQQNVS